MMDAMDDLAEWRAQREAERLAAWAPPRVPVRFAAARTADLEPTVAAEVDSWVAAAGSCPAPNLLLFGPTGPGKTYAAFAAAHRLWMEGRSVDFWPVPELFDHLQPGAPRGALGPILAADVLILDDLGVEKPTEWKAERLYVLVNRRWMDGRPIVATSNLAPTDLEKFVGPRIYSRLANDETIAVHCGGPDRRRSRR